MDTLEALLRFTELDLEVPATILAEDLSGLEDWEEKYCLSRNVQIHFSAEFLRDFLTGASRKKLFQILDVLDIQVSAFFCDNRWILLGPFQEPARMKGHLEEVLAGYSIPAHCLTDFKNYLAGFTVIDSLKVFHAASHILEVMGEDTASFQFESVSPYTRDYKAYLPAFEFTDEKTYVSHHQVEKDFISALKEGDEEEALKQYGRMNLATEKGAHLLQSLKGQMMSTVMLLMLCRQALQEKQGDCQSLDDLGFHYSAAVLHCETSASLESLRIRMIRDFAGLSQDRDYSPAVSRTLSFLRKNYSRMCSLEELSREAGLSPCYLSRLFREEVGENISSFVSRLRTEKAAQLLRDSSLPVQNISAYVGYADNNYFTKVFKKHFGCTPSEYRSGAAQKGEKP